MTQLDTAKELEKIAKYCKEDAFGLRSFPHENDPSQYASNLSFGELSAIIDSEVSAVPKLNWDLFRETSDSRDITTDWRLQ